MRQQQSPASSYGLGLILLSLLLLSRLANALPAAGNLVVPDWNKRQATSNAGRERISINSDWKFQRFTSNPDGLSYNTTLKPWILPSANDFIVGGAQHERPSASAPPTAEYVEASFDDGAWESVALPHDWAIKGPFGAPGISGGMGRLPSNGVGWYRRKLSFAAEDAGKSVFLDVDGAMSYAAVWLNGQLVGGWPYGYASFRLDLTPYLRVGDDNVLAVRLDNALESSRWYPGAGIYRNIWVVKVDRVHVAQYGTYITTPSVSSASATVQLVVDVENKGNGTRKVGVATEIHTLEGGDVVASFPTESVEVAAGAKASVNGSVTVANPQLWGPPPSQKPNLYVAVTTVLSEDGQSVIDTYETRFGIREVKFDPDQGVLVNGEHVRVQGVCNHHDLGSLGAAFNRRAAERQLEMLQEMGTNALRTSHNPPAPELVDMTDELGFLVMDEAFDVWEEAKVDDDYHLLFPDWHEPDMRALIRRDRNHPSVISWSIGNEIPEQGNAKGAATGKILHDIIKEEDPTRPSTSAMNNAGPSSGLAGVVDIISLNYQGEGRGASWSSTFPSFHSTFPNKMIWTSESSSVLSTRGTYIFPVAANSSAVVEDDGGVDESALYVSAYELYGPSWGGSPDKVFEQQDRHPYVGGEFVWTGFDYLGEPTPYDDEPLARSSYFGIIDMAGFRKDRFYLYQARWRPDLPMAHILPHWSFGDERVGRVTPVHVFSSADEAELFVNGESVGRVARDAYEYRFRWDNVTFAPGEMRVQTWKDGAAWAEDSKRTVGAAASLTIEADRATIAADGYDLSFVSVAVVDEAGDVVPYANNTVTFSVASGPGEIVATDNGDPTDQTVFPSLVRKAFNGFALAVVRTRPGEAGEIVVEAVADGLAGGSVTLQAA